MAADKVAAASLALQAAASQAGAAAGKREVIEALVRLVVVNRRKAILARARRAALLKARRNKPLGSITLVEVETVNTLAAIRRDLVVVDPAPVCPALVRPALDSLAVDNTAAVNTATARNTALAITTTVAAALRTTVVAPAVMVIDPRTWPAAPYRTVIPERHMAATPAVTAAASGLIITAGIPAITMVAAIRSRMDIARRITAVGITVTGMAIGDIPGDFGRLAGTGAAVGDWALVGDSAPALRSAFRSARRGLGAITLITIRTGLRRSLCRSISTTRNRSS